MSAARELTLFDLDHTLIPFDSGLHWACFWVAQGVLEPQVAEAYLAQCQAYVEGRVSIEALHRLAVATLARFGVQEGTALQARFGAAIAGVIPSAARMLVERHRQAGALCAIVTTTNELIAQPFARAFGVDALLATRIIVEGDAYAGAIAGLPCHGDEKIRRVEDWLSSQGLDWQDFAATRFYSDAFSDLPLLERVAEPIVVRPDARLRAHALAHGWQVIEVLV